MSQYGVASKDYLVSMVGFTASRPGANWVERTRLNARLPPAPTPRARGCRQFQSLNFPPQALAKVEKIAVGSGIKQRHCVFVGNPDAPGYVPPEAFAPLLESPGERGRIWEKHAPAMAISAARDALAKWAHGTAADVTHVVVHSCTGFAAPGLDYALIAALGLRPSTRKIGVNFMGCFGGVLTPMGWGGRLPPIPSRTLTVRDSVAPPTLPPVAPGFTAMYVAKSIIESDGTGKAVVLIACAETCTIHMSRDERVELIVGNTLFADGAGAMIVCHKGFAGLGKPRLPVGTRQWALGAFASNLIADSAHTMTWKQSEEAGRYDMWLDRAIPGLMQGMFAGDGLGMLRRVGIRNPWRAAWAIHPGGKAILQAFADVFAKLHIKGEGLETSMDVLREHGNMSSATIMYVLAALLPTTQADDVFTAGFGPGLTVEYGRIYRVRTGVEDAVMPEQTGIPAADSGSVASPEETATATGHAAPTLRRRSSAERLFQSESG
jgi:predicted naringenin-chalcone synthase